MVPIYTQWTSNLTGVCTPTSNINYTSATTDTLREELKGYIGLPVNSANISRIKGTITTYIKNNKATATGDWITLGASGDCGSGNYYQGTGEYGDSNALIHVFYNNETTSLEIAYDGITVESEEDRKKREALYKRFEKQQQIKSNLLIKVNSRAKFFDKIPGNEQIAMESLREVITETEFRKYLKYGFVIVKGRSGKTYQIFKNNSHTKVWLGGKLIEEICIRIADFKIPPTDNVLAVKTMLETNEEECYKLANIYKMEEAA